VTIGATPGVGVYLLPDWISSFRARYPKLTISTQTGITSEIISGILAQRVDLGVIEGELEDKRASRLAIKVLERVEQFVVVGWRHPWWDRQSVPLPALADQTFIMRPRNHQSRIWLDQVLEAHGITPQIGTEFDNLESIKRAAASGTCLTILPEYVFKQEESLGMLRRVRIDDAPLQREIKLIWSRDAAASPVARAFTRHVEAEFAGVVQPQSGP
jgi:DNA-binding transcriptional LysR family regulator